MKKLISLIAALVMVLSLTGCFGMGTASNGSSTADQASAAEVDTYDKDFKGLQKYITDRNSKAKTSELYYDIVGAKNGIRIILNDNAYVEVYDYTDANSETAKAILADIKDDGKFNPMENSIDMTAVITDSGNYVLAWDATRSYDYAKNVATDELIANW